MHGMNRRDFAAYVAKSAALAGAVFGSAEAMDGQIVWSKNDWDISDFNGLLTAPGDLKQVFDISSVNATLDKVKNSLNGLQVGFGVPAVAIHTVAGLHGTANFLNFDDFIWSKYKIGEWLGIKDPKSGEPALRNAFYKSSFAAAPLTGDPSDLESPWHDVSMEGLKRRNVKFIGCHTALEFQVRELIKWASLSSDPETIVRDMLDHLQPGSLMVASMVSALALLQLKGHYAYVKL